MSQPFKLFRIQQIDIQLDKGQSRLEELERLIADDRDVRLARQRLENAQKARFASEKKLRLAEENVRQQRLKIERSQAALYGGKVVNPKELQDLQHESEALQRYLVTLEDQQLEAMLELDEVEAAVIQAESDQAITEDQALARNTQLTMEKSEMIHDLQINENERRAASANIDADDMRLYETLRKQKNGIAVARVVDKNCAACGSTLPAMTLSSVRVPDKITRCSTCGRILYAG